MPLFKAGDIVCGRFTIDKLVGTGGMSEVYRGRDSKLDNRIVAIKALRARPSINAEARNRVLTEVRSLAKLNHPHIATLYDVCSHENSDVLVMEFLEGTPLSDLLRTGSLPEPEALGYAMQIADALAYAHQQGVVHRDIKPGNIVITARGATLLDFGIAKLSRQEEFASGAAAGSETETETMDTVVAGTPFYMSPEQRSGAVVDHRTDIFSFGLVLAQMVTGAIQSPAGGILDRITSKTIRLVVRKCVSTAPEERWQSAGDMSSALGVIAETLEQPAPSPAPPKVEKRRPRTILLVGLALALLALGVWGFYVSPVRPAAQYGFLVAPPAGTHFISLEVGGPPAISPDGRTVAFVAAKDVGEETSIWLLALNSVEPAPVRGSDGATHPFWAPDSRSLAFFGGGKLKRIDLPGGAPQDLCDALHGRGGAWSKDQIIIFTPDFTEALYSVPAGGGRRQKITEPRFTNGETSHRWPSFLPDGRKFLFFIRSDRPEVQGLYLGSLDNPALYTLVENIASSAVYAKAPGGGEGYLLFTDGGFLFARRFSESTGKFVGESARIVQLPSPQEDTSVSPVSVSTDGTLVSGGGSVYRQTLQWVDSRGAELSKIEAYGQYRNPRLSRDRRMIAVEKLEIKTGFASIWVFDIDRNLQNPFEQFSRAAFSPVWSPDGKSLLYAAFNGLWDLARRDLGNESGVNVLRKGGVQVATDWPSKGGWVLFQEKGDTKADQWDLGALEISSGATKKLLATEKNERQGRLSPNGQWLAYTSNEFGPDQVFLARFPSMAPRVAVSEGGANQPVWSADGKELFYVSGDRVLMRVRVESGLSPPGLGKPEPLFALNMFRATGFTAPVNYDVDSEGGRFLIATPPQIENLHQQLTVRVNWLAQASRN